MKLRKFGIVSLFVLSTSCQTDGSAGSPSDWDAALEKIKSQAYQPYCEKVNFEQSEFKPLNDVFPDCDCRYVSYQCWFKSGAPEAKGAMARSAFFVIRKGDSRPYELGDLTDMRELAKSSGQYLKTQDQVRDFADAAFGAFFADGKITKVKPTVWNVISYGSGVPVAGAYEFETDESGKLTEIRAGRVDAGLCEEDEACKQMIEMAR